MTPMLFSPDTMATALAASFVGLVLLAVGTTPILAVACQQLAILRNKNFYDKLAKQLASMATTLGGVFLTAIAAGAAHAAIRTPEIFQGPFRLPLMAVLGTVTFAYGLLVAYTLLWKTLRQSKSLHMLIGAFTAVTMGSGIFLVLGLARSMMQLGHAVPANAGNLAIFTTIYSIPAGSLTWPLYAQCLIGGIGAAAMLGQCYLLLRRNRDDFGRDYYKFAAPTCATWAIVPTLLQLLPAAWLFTILRPALGPVSADNPLMLCGAIAGALPLAACLLWVRVRRSETPMRHKVAIILSLPLALAAVSAQLLVLMHRFGI